MNTLTPSNNTLTPSNASNTDRTALAIKDRADQSLLPIQVRTTVTNGKVFVQVSTPLIAIVHKLLCQEGLAMTKDNNVIELAEAVHNHEQLIDKIA